MINAIQKPHTGILFFICKVFFLDHALVLKSFELKKIIKVLSIYIHVFRNQQQQQQQICMVICCHTQKRSLYLIPLRKRRKWKKMFWMVLLIPVCSMHVRTIGF